MTLPKTAMKTKRLLLRWVVLCAFCAFAEEPVHMRRFTRQISIDGELAEWKGAPQFSMAKPNVPDLGCDFAAVGWTDTHLLVAITVRDTKIVNTNEADRLSNGDCAEFRFCSADDSRSHYYRLCVAPTSASGGSAASFAKCVGKAREAVEGVEWAVLTGPKSWTVEAAIPFDRVGAKPAEGGKLPFVCIVWDRDRADKDEWGTGWKKRMESSSQKSPPSEWPAFVFASAGTVAAKTVKDGLAAVRHDPCNMFAPDEDVVLAFKPKFPAGTTGVCTIHVADAYGREHFTRVQPFEPENGLLLVDFGPLPRGYWEAQIDCSLTDAAGVPSKTSAKATFGVMERQSFDLAEFMRQDRRFGMKWWSGVSDKEECKRLICSLGLNWSRAIFDEAAMLSSDTAINPIVKVERFPKELYNEAKYGPLDEWEKKFGRGGWTLKTLPKEKEYRAWLRGQIASIPEDRNVFEIWNEPWDKFNARDFATLSGWIADEMRKVRPGAILGPNLKGDTSKYGYDAQVIDAGGMVGMDMVCLHPYSTCEDRQWLRDYKKWISGKCGKPIDIYITEYGAHSCPQGPSRRSEREQAAMTIRQSLCLYAEDCKALVPHWIGQSEKNPTYHEDWFGYIRKNLQPKPAIVALANCARLIDASEYRGDLWFGPGLAAMLFAKNGAAVLALYGQGGAKDFALRLPAERLTLVDIYGMERGIEATNGVFTVSVGGEPVYLTGLPGGMVGDKVIRPDRFPQPEKPPRNVRRVAKMAKEPIFDGMAGEWKGAFEVAIQNEKVNGDDASGLGYLAWDDRWLYVAVDMRDNELLNMRPRSALYQQDSVELFVSTEPHDENPGYGPNDCQFMVTPASGEGKPICGWVADRAAGVVVDVRDAKLAVGTTPKGWTLECAIPWAQFGAFRPRQGDRIAFELRVNDADTSHERWKLDPLDGNVRPEDPTAWSIFEFD